MAGQDLMTASAVLVGRRLVVEFRRGAGFIPAGVAILSAGDEKMTVSSLHCISFDPPLISVALSRESRKVASILATGRFHLRLLRNGEEGLAKGEGSACGAGLVEMDCVIVANYPVGDHDLVVASATRVHVSDGYPIVYWRRGLHVLRPQYDFLASPDTLEKFVAAWENGTLMKGSWTHAAHVAIGTYYTVCYPASAVERTKAGIMLYNRAVATENAENSGYHETLTRFWADVLARFAKGIEDPWKAVCHAVEKLGEDRELHHLYYSFDVVRSSEARRTWIPPDLDGPY
jgi:flavin reductase (DIM6/NTAB) family NADH-FMN oxidoreductase RutF